MINIIFTDKIALKNDSLIKGRLEEKEDSISEKNFKSELTNLKWLSDKKLQNFNYRVLFENPNSKFSHAIYLSEWKEAIKIRDFSIVSAITDENNKSKISSKDFFKYSSTHWRVLHSVKVIALDTYNLPSPKTNPYLLKPSSSKSSGSSSNMREKG